ncbi:MAG: hypothetical protein ACRDTC_01610 [Pseudonocardiaceae bacterium]
MISKSSTVYQTSYGLVRERLRGVLGAVVESGPGAEHERGSVSWRACAALYSLVEEHPVDRRGRCRSCRRRGALLWWVRRRCQVRVWACFWLHQPDEALLGLLARELDQQPGPSPGAEEQADCSGSGRVASAPGPDSTDVFPRIDLDQDDTVPQASIVPGPSLSGGGCPPARGSAAETPTARSVAVRRSG